MRFCDQTFFAPDWTVIWFSSSIQLTIFQLRKLSCTAQVWATVFSVLRCGHNLAALPNNECLSDSPQENRDCPKRKAARPSGENNGLNHQLCPRLHTQTCSWRQPVPLCELNHSSPPDLRKHLWATTRLHCFVSSSFAKEEMIRKRLLFLLFWMFEDFCLSLKKMHCTKKEPTSATHALLLLHSLSRLMSWPLVVRVWTLNFALQRNEKSTPISVLVHILCEYSNIKNLSQSAYEPKLLGKLSFFFSSVTKNCNACASQN